LITAVCPAAARAGEGLAGAVGRIAERFDRPGHGGIVGQQPDPDGGLAGLGAAGAG
jgi:hypothetical protein